MAKRTPRNIPAKLNTAEIRITNSLNDDVIKTSVAGVGYTLDRLNEGKVSSIWQLHSKTST